jgi:formyltetrahydrofolate synthetase
MSEPQPIEQVAARLGLEPADLERSGNWAAKVDSAVLQR